MNLLDRTTKGTDKQESEGTRNAVGEDVGVDLPELDQGLKPKDEASWSLPSSRLRPTVVDHLRDGDGSVSGVVSNDVMPYHSINNRRFM